MGRTINNDRLIINHFKKMELYKSVRIYFLISILGLLVLGCSSQEKISKFSFQGEINYDVSLSILDNTMSSELKKYYRGHFGDSVNIKYDSDGNIFMKYFGSVDRGYDYSVYNNLKNVIYTKFKGVDTIYSVDCSSNTMRLIEKELDTNVLNIQGENCNKLTLKSEDTISNEVVIQEFYFSRDIYLDPNIYSKFKNFFFSDFISESESVYLKKVTDYGTFKVTYEATGVSPSALVDDIDLSIVEDFPIHQVW